MTSQETALANAAQTRIWLASRSPRRQELLSQIGIPFELLLPDDQVAAEKLENTRPGESPTNYVQRVTLAKLELAMRNREQRQLELRPILAADTTVAIGGKILGKPATRELAATMLSDLAGRSHRVLSGVAVAHGQRIAYKVQVSRVQFARISDRQIEAYLDTDEYRGKAGGYGIQGDAAKFVRRIEGSHSGIMGLPLYETRILLKR